MPKGRTKYTSLDLATGDLENQTGIEKPASSDSNHNTELTAHRQPQGTESAEATAVST